jgi:hypothetical protein
MISCGFEKLSFLRVQCRESKGQFFFTLVTRTFQNFFTRELIELEGFTFCFVLLVVQIKLSMGLIMWTLVQ